MSKLTEKEIDDYLQSISDCIRIYMLLPINKKTVDAIVSMAECYEKIDILCRIINKEKDIKK